MNARTARLVLLLRLAYLIGAALFVLDLLVGGAIALVQISETGDVDEHGPAASLVEWGALIAFCFTALGAVITVVATVRLTRNGDPGDVVDPVRAP